MEAIRLRGTADILAALPYQLGYHLDECLVAVAIHGRQVGLVARIDLPPSVASEVVTEATASLTGPFLRERPDGILLVGYESIEGQCDALTECVAATVEAGGLAVVERIVVRDGRWYSRDCSDPGCCPVDGAPLPDPSETPAVADFVALGLAPLPDRADLARLLAADEAACRPVAAALRRRDSPPGAAFGLGAAPEEPFPDVAVQRLAWLSLWRRVCDVGPDAAAIEGLAPADVAELVSSLGDILLRDGLVAWLCPGTLPLDALPEDLVDQLRSSLPRRPWRDSGREEPMAAGKRLLGRLQALARAVPDSHAAGVLTVTANVAWWLGDGSVARVALDRALAHAPGYRLARLLDQMVGLGLRPEGLP